MKLHTHLNHSNTRQHPGNATEKDSEKRQPHAYTQDTHDIRDTHRTHKSWETNYGEISAICHKLRQQGTKSQTANQSAPQMYSNFCRQPETKARIRHVGRIFPVFPPCARPLPPLAFFSDGYFECSGKVISIIAKPQIYYNSKRCWTGHWSSPVYMDGVEWTANTKSTGRGHSFCHCKL